MRLSVSIPACALVALLSSGVPTWAQGHRGGGAVAHAPRQQPHPPARGARTPKPGRGAAAGPRPVEEFMRMSPAEREKALEHLPSDRQEKVRQQLQRYDQMPPERKAQLQRLWELPADKQQKVRQSMRDLGEQPPERRRAMLQQIQRMNDMDRDERKHYLKSNEFKGQFSKPEQEIMKNMSEILPPA